MTAEQKTKAAARKAWLGLIFERYGITFADCVQHFGQGDENPYVAAARGRHEDGELEFDDRVVVSGSDSYGDYVLGWVWISNEEAGIKDEDCHW